MTTNPASTIYFLRGLPASGKTTLAHQYIAKGAKRVSKDDLRAMLHGSRYTPELEEFVLVVRNEIIKRALGHGFDVVVDDTNLNPKHLLGIEMLAAEYGALYKIVDVNTPIEECIQRDAERGERGEHSVGEAIIRAMYNDYLKGPQ